MEFLARVAVNPDTPRTWRNGRKRGRGGGGGLHKLEGKGEREFWSWPFLSTHIKRPCPWPPRYSTIPSPAATYL